MNISEMSPLATGTWGDSISWEIHSSQELPPSELITAVAGVALTAVSKEVVLTRNQRGGWEVLAGHIEPGEDIETALAREALEEGGFKVIDTEPIGYRKITTIRRPLHGSREAKYPFPLSYIAYFLIHTDRPTIAPSGEEILESRSFPVIGLPELVRTGQLSEMEYTIIRLGLEADGHNSKC